MKGAWCIFKIVDFPL